MFVLPKAVKQIKRKVHPVLYTDSGKKIDHHTCLDSEFSVNSKPLCAFMPGHQGTLCEEYLEEGMTKAHEDLALVNIMMDKDTLFPAEGVQMSVPHLPPCLKDRTCPPDIFRCTMNNIPKTEELLKKIKIPLGFIFQPFQDSQVPYMVSDRILPRCTHCRTYINPFVSFECHPYWKCTSCLSLNRAPDDFMNNTEKDGADNIGYQQPELQQAVVEFQAPSEYSAQPMPPLVYLFVFDVTATAAASGYLPIVCHILQENLHRLPSNDQTLIGFITFDSLVHFYSFEENLSEPQMITSLSTEDIVIPIGDNLLVNLTQRKQEIASLLKLLPTKFRESNKRHCAFGAALQAAQKLIGFTGGRVSIFLSQLPNKGCGTLYNREWKSNSTGSLGWKELAPAEFYKTLATTFAAQDTTVDFFLLSPEYCDVASLSSIPRTTCGSIYFYPGFHHIREKAQVEKLHKEFLHYLIRPIGTKALLRICRTEGLTLPALCGNSQVPCSDLLHIPIISPDSVFTVQMEIKEKLVEWPFVTFQSCLLYTSGTGERRVRVQTACLPMATSTDEVYSGVDAEAVIGMLSKMAVELSFASSTACAKEAVITSICDILSQHRSTISDHKISRALTVPYSLRYLSLYVLGLLKQVAFQSSADITLDERAFIMYQLMTQPLYYIMQMIYPSLYQIDSLTTKECIPSTNERPRLSRLQLSVQQLTSSGAFLLNCGHVFYIWVGRKCSDDFLQNVLGVDSTSALPAKAQKLPELRNAESLIIQKLIQSLRKGKCLHPICYIIKDGSSANLKFMQHLLEDASESTISYQEFILLLQQRVCK